MSCVHALSVLEVPVSVVVVVILLRIAVPHLAVLLNDGAPYVTPRTSAAHKTLDDHSGLRLRRRLARAEATVAIAPSCPRRFLLLTLGVFSASLTLGPRRLAIHRSRLRPRLSWALALALARALADVSTAAALTAATLGGGAAARHSTCEHVDASRARRLLQHVCWPACFDLGLALQQFGGVLQLILGAVRERHVRVGAGRGHRSPWLPGCWLLHHSAPVSMPMSAWVIRNGVSNCLQKHGPEFRFDGAGAR